MKYMAATHQNAVAEQPASSQFTPRSMSRPSADPQPEEKPQFHTSKRTREEADSPQDNKRHRTDSAVEGGRPNSSASSSKMSEFPIEYRGLKKLTEEERSQYRLEGRCFACRQLGHLSRDQECPLSSIHRKRKSMENGGEQNDSLGGGV
jgi:hypothetical protein